VVWGCAANVSSPEVGGLFCLFFPPRACDRRRFVKIIDNDLKSTTGMIWSAIGDLSTDLNRKKVASLKQRPVIRESRSV
jgi:hypothetical protein